LGGFLESRLSGSLKAGNPAQREIFMNWTSARPSPSAVRNPGIAIGNRTVVFSGHGKLCTRTDAPPNDSFVVPQGMTIVFWCAHGNPFAGTDLDRRLHIGDFQPQQFNEATPAQDAWAIAAGKTQGPAFQVGAHRGLPEVIRAGQRCRNYRLTPPTGLVLGNRAGDVRFVTVADRGPLNIGHRLSDLLQQHRDICQNATIHWAACRVEKPV